MVLACGRTGADVGVEYSKIAQIARIPNGGSLDIRMGVHTVPTLTTEIGPYITRPIADMAVM